MRKADESNLKKTTGQKPRKVNSLQLAGFTARHKRLLSLLVSIREDRGLSQRALSKKLKKTPTFVSKYERGERRLDLVEFLDIVKVLEADPHEIIRRIAG